MIPNILKGRTPEGLKQKSTSILEVFTSTIKQLQEVNKIATEECEAKLKQRDRLTTEITALNKLHMSNGAIIDKISNLLWEEPK